MSKLNPQKATAYVGPGVLRKGGKITPVPNGPLIKKTGKFKGSTLKNGGPIRKAQNGTTTTQTTTPVKKPTWQQMTQAQKSAKKAELMGKGGIERFKQYKDSISADATSRREADFAKGAAKRGMTPAEYSAYIKKQAKSGDAPLEGLDIKGATKRGDSKGSCRTGQKNEGESLKDNKRNGGSINNKKLGIMNKKKNGGPIKGTNAQLTLPKFKKLSAKEMKAPAKVDISKFNKAKSGAMIKRADGSMSRRGLWDNIRANKGSGKKPTAAMLKQERKIKAKSKK